MRCFWSTIVLASFLSFACGDAEEQTPFTLVVEQPSLRMRVGEQASLRVRVEPAVALPGAVRIQAGGLPVAVSAPPVFIPSDEPDGVALLFAAGEEAETGGPFHVQIRATLGGTERSETIALTIAGAPGALDTSFGNDGTAYMPGNLSYMGDMDVASGADGSIVAAARAYQDPEGFAGSYLFRYAPGGVPDPALGRGGVRNLEVEGAEETLCRPVRMQRENQLLVACEAVLPEWDPATGRNRSKLLALRFRADGGPQRWADGSDTLPLEWPDAEPYLYHLNLGGRDRTVLTTRLTLKDGGASVGSALTVVRYLEDGRWDPTFGEGGEFRIALKVRPQQIIELATGGYVIVAIEEVEASVSGIVLRLNDAGQLVDAFGERGIVRLDDLPLSVGADSNGRIYVLAFGEGGRRVLALDEKGEPSPAFGDAGEVALEPHGAQALAVGPDDLLYLAGRFASEGAPGPLLLQRFTAEGVLDTAFAHRTISEPGTGASWLGFDTDGRILLRGSRADHPQEGSSASFLRRYWP